MKRFHVTTFGCQMNEHDSERMKGMLESLGYSEVPERGEADLILFNTCSIREKADERFVSHLYEARALKRRDPERVIGVGGCWAQSVKDQVFRQFPFVDVAFGPGQVHKLAEFLTSDSLTAQGFFEFEGFTGHLPGKRARDVHAWVQISAGCNMKCSYCIVPSTRGREVSRPLEELVAEVRGLAGEGVREVTLLGQNVNSYGLQLRPRPRRFSELLVAVDAIEGIDRVRYTSPHPAHMREDVIRAHAELESLCRHIHLPDNLPGFQLFDAQFGLPLQPGAFVKQSIMVLEPLGKRRSIVRIAMNDPHTISQNQGQKQRPGRNHEAARRLFLQARFASPVKKRAERVTTSNIVCCHQGCVGSASSLREWPARQHKTCTLNTSMEAWPSK